MDSIVKEEVASTPLVDKLSVMGFVDTNQAPSISVPSLPDPTMHYETFSDASLDEFFLRPVRLESFAWSVGTQLAGHWTDPYKAYFNNLAVRRKLDNYHMMRATLHVKVVINGSPFHFAKVFVGQLPQYRTASKGLPDFALDPAMRGLRITQLPHVCLDVSTQQTAEMEIPFIYPYNYIPVSEMCQPTEKISDISALYLFSGDLLRSVSATASPTIQVTLFGWATDVELVIPTSAIVSASKKGKRRSVSDGRDNSGTRSRASALKNKVSGMVNNLASVDIPPDEKKDGLISAVSSTVANVAGKLADVPIIGGYASTVKGIANGVTNVARFFGFSRPPVLTDTMVVKTQLFSNIANTEGSEPIHKLTFDPLQALTVAPASTGLADEDELSFKMMTSRESLFTTVYWSASDAIDTQIMFINVTPNIVRTESVLPDIGKHIQFSSIGFASYPFKYWSGSIKYRFQVVCSPYHTGRLRLTFEPNGATFSATSFNTTYSQIIDLAHSTDVTFTVPWAQNVPYKEVGADLIHRFYIPPGGIFAYIDSEYNGTLYVSVLNPLVSPDSSVPVSINVFISAGDDFELSVPQASFEQLGLESWGTIPIVSASQPGVLQSDESAHLFGEPLEPSEVAAKETVFFGEAITSFRPLLKRYQKALDRFTPYTGLGTTYGQYSSFLCFRYPPAYGPNTTPNVSGYQKVTAPVAANFFSEAPNHLVHYLSAGFVGKRGGIRWKILPINDQYDCNVASVIRDADEMAFTNANPWTYRAAAYSCTGTVFAAQELSANLAEQSTWKGAIVEPVHYGQNGLELELPFYSNARFVPATLWGVRAPSNAVGSINPAAVELFYVDCRISGTGAATNYRTMLRSYYAMAEDFTFNFYVGPALFFQSYTYTLDVS